MNFYLYFSIIQILIDKTKMMILIVLQKVLLYHLKLFQKGNLLDSGNNKVIAAENNGRK